MEHRTVTEKASRNARIKAKIERSQERLRAGTPAPLQKVIDASEPARDAVGEFARKHPIATVAGGVAVGFLAGRLLPRAMGGKLVRGAITAATLAADFGLLYGAKAGAGAAVAGSTAARAGRAGLAAARSTSALASGKVRGTGLALAGEVLKIAARARR